MTLTESFDLVVAGSGAAGLAAALACGNDSNSITGGFYPSGGITIGPAITFAYLAVMHAAAAEQRLAVQ